MKKRMLLLTLGTGPLQANNEAGYHQTQYTIDDEPYKKDGVAKLTNFVAEPIIDFFEPDEIIVLGTVKSVWHQFYASITTVDNEDKSYLEDANYLRLIEIEKNHGKDTPSEELVKFSDEMTRIFSTISSEKWSKYTKKYTNMMPKIRVLLTKYGISNNELIENYQILKRIEESLEKDVEYEVAFDITHSFRSLPLYNLVIFNYIKNITRYHIEITHIYYGNVEVVREKGDAPIVDLADLGKVLNLTSGVTEFKDTGNAVYLLKLIESENNEDALRKTLDMFDLSTQLNDFKNIKIALTELAAIVKAEALDARFTGVREMIETVLSEKFFETEDGKIPDLSEIGDADLKFMLTKWFFSQNKIGLGLATGLEALRDINTPVFMETRGFPEQDARKYRENAETYFIQIATRIQAQNKAQLSDLEQAVCDLGLNLRHYKEIRNIFAHSLSSSSSVELKDVRDDIRNFQSSLETLKQEYDANKARYRQMFVPVSGASTAKTITGDKCRVIIEIQDNCNPEQYKKSKNGVEYTVFTLHNDVKMKFFGGINGKSYNLTEKAYFLMKYLKKQIPENYNSIQLILHGCKTPEKEQVFQIFAEVLCNEKVKLFTNKKGPVEPCKMVKLMLALDDYESEFMDQELVYEACMEKPLVQR